MSDKSKRETLIAFKKLKKKTMCKSAVLIHSYEIHCSLERNFFIGNFIIDMKLLIINNRIKQLFFSTIQTVKFINSKSKVFVNVTCPYCLFIS